MSRRAKEIAAGLQDLGKRAVANPVSAVLAALAAGFVLGLALRVFERPPIERGGK